MTDKPLSGRAKVDHANKLRMDVMQAALDEQYRQNAQLREAIRRPSEPPPLTTVTAEQRRAMAVERERREMIRRPTLAPPTDPNAPELLWDLRDGSAVMSSRPGEALPQRSTVHQSVPELGSETLPPGVNIAPRPSPSNPERSSFDAYGRHGSAGAVMTPADTADVWVTNPGEPEQ